MAHYQSLSQGSLSFSEANLTAPNTDGLNNTDKIVLGLNQNVYATLGSTEAILNGQKATIKAIEAGYRESLKQNKDKMIQDMFIAKAQIQAIDDLNYELGNGFAEMNNILFNLGKDIDIRLVALTEQTIITNTKLDTLIEALKIPEFEKERVYFISEGIKYLSQALKSPKRYVDSLEMFLEAEKRNKRDYFTLHQLGLIYLYSADCLDLEKAELYLSNASDYAETSNDKIVASTYFHLGYSQYIQGKYNEAIKSCKSAYKSDKSLKESLIILAESCVFSNNMKELEKVLNKMVNSPDYNDFTKLLKNNLYLKNIPEVKDKLYGELKTKADEERYEDIQYEYDLLFGNYTTPKGHVNYLKNELKDIEFTEDNYRMIVLEKDYLKRNYSEFVLKSYKEMKEEYERRLKVKYSIVDEMYGIIIDLEESKSKLSKEEYYKKMKNVIKILKVKHIEECNASTESGLYYCFIDSAIINNKQQKELKKYKDIREKEENKGNNNGIKFVLILMGVITLFGLILGLSS